MVGGVGECGVGGVRGETVVDCCSVQRGVGVELCAEEDVGGGFGYGGVAPGAAMDVAVGVSRRWWWREGGGRRT